MFFPPSVPKVLLCTVYLALAACHLVRVYALSWLGPKVIKIGTCTFGVLPVICR